MFDVRGDAHDVALSGHLSGLAAFLIAAFARDDEESLTARVLVPVRAGTRLERDVPDRRVEDGVVFRREEQPVKNFP